MNLSSPSGDNVIAIFGVPRSGTSWLGQIFNSSPRVAFRFQPLFSYEFKNRLKSDSSSEEIKKFYSDLWGADSDFVLQKTNISGRQETEFAKQNMDILVWKEVRYIDIINNLAEKSDTKHILLVRHPGAVINSWLRAPREFKDGWDPIAEWRYAKKKNEDKEENFYGYEKWKEAMYIFLKLKQDYPDKVMLVKYEDLVADPLDGTKNMFDFAGLQLEKQTMEFLSDSSSREGTDAYSVYRKSQDPEKWRSQLNREIIEEVSRDFDESGLMDQLGYSR